MKHISLLNRVVLAFMAVFLLSANAAAQSTILVVDQAKIMRESEVGKHITRQLETIAKSMENELKSSTAPLKSQRDTLMSELKNMDEAALRSRPDLQKKAQDLVAKSQKQQREAAYMSRELKITEAKAYQKINKTLSSILEKVVKERNADVVLDRSLVIYGKPADVTDVVMSRLNSQLRTVSVSRERLPRK